MIFKKNRLVCKNLPEDSVFNNFINDKGIIDDLGKIKMKQVSFVNSCSIKKFLSSKEQFMSKGKVLIENKYQVFENDTIMEFEFTSDNNEQHRMLIVNPEELYHSAFVYGLFKLVEGE